MIDWAYVRRRRGDASAVEAPIHLTTPTPSALVAELREHFRSGRGFALATLNLDHVVRLRRSASFRRTYRAHTHVVADGKPIVWLSRFSGHPVNLVAGSDMTLPLMRLAAEEDATIAFIGGTEASLEAAKAVAERHAPSLQVAYMRAPSFGFDPVGLEADEIIAELVASGAKLCLVALGAERQETFAIHARAAAPSIGFASIGAGLDFVAGTQRRAPKIFRKMSIEWVWRLASNPRRMARRYAMCILILPSLVVLAWQTRQHTQRNRLA